MTWWLKISTGRKQTSWLFTNLAKEYNSVQQRTTPACGQYRTWTPTYISSLAPSLFSHECYCIGCQLKSRHRKCATPSQVVWGHVLPENCKFTHQISFYYCRCKLTIMSKFSKKNCETRNTFYYSKVMKNIFPKSGKLYPICHEDKNTSLCLCEPKHQNRVHGHP